MDAIQFVVDRVAGRVPVVAGAGSNHTDYAVWLSKEAEACGADALLQVTPYYNKASQRGLVRHFTVKEACGNISQVAALLAACGDELAVYSGNDDQIVPILSLGGKGVISVVANILPQQTHDICAKFFAGDVAGSARLQL